VGAWPCNPLIPSVFSYAKLTSNPPNIVIIIY